MRVALVIIAGLIALTIPYCFVGRNITTRAIDLPHGYSLQLVTSDVVLTTPSNTFIGIPFLTAYVALVAMSLAAVVMIYILRNRPKRGFDVQPPTDA